MSSSRGDFSAVASRAASLWERLAETGSREFPSCGSSEQTDRRLKRWQQVVGNGDALTFQRRLDFEGLTRGRVEAALALAEAPLGSRPRWLAILEDLTESIRTYRSHPKPNMAGPTRPFEHLLRSLTYAARQRLRHKIDFPETDAAPCGIGRLSATACRSLETGLLDRLTLICAPSLQTQFSAFRPAGHGLLNAMVGPTNGGTTRHYDAFVSRWLTLDLNPLFETYPVVARLVVEMVDDWVNFCAEFHRHVVQDAALIEDCFDVTPGALSEIVDLRYGLSDPHHHGRCVMRVTFSGGLTLAYKPRSLGVDCAFDRLLTWCGQRGLSIDLKCARILDMGDHGWMEWIQQRACSDTAAVGRFYRRAGMLVALLHMLRGTDCHHENLIASGEHPMLIDLETLMVPDHDWSRETGDSMLDETFWQSVIRTGMLPRWEEESHPSTPYDISALGGIGAQETPAHLGRWQCINTDDMDMYDEPVSLPPRANAVVLDGAVVPPAEHVCALVDGFGEMYRLLLRHRAELLASDGPLAAFRNQPIRYVARSTQEYGLILRHSCEPDQLENGCDRSIDIDYLSRGRFDCLESHGAVPLLAAERRALERLDIPRFFVTADEAVVRADGEEMVSNMSIKSAYRKVIERVESMSGSDLAVQTRIIEGSLHAWRRDNTQVDFIESTDVGIRNRQQDGARDAADSLRQPDFLREAAAIAAIVAATALENRDGSLSWIRLSHLPAGRRYQLSPVGGGLYDGRCGIALFLAACDRVQRSTMYQSHVERALQPLRARLRRDDSTGCEDLVRSVGIGIAEGVGGLVYALSCIGDWWQDSSLLDDAELLARSVPLDLIASDQQLDVIGGSAGALLGLLKLCRLRNSPETLALARTCAERLCRLQHAEGQHRGGWPNTAASRPLTGFSHGASGIAFALAGLHAVTLDPQLLAATEGAVEFERRGFVPAAGNWIDFRRSVAAGSASCATSWCHGAPGIALARLALLRAMPTSVVAEDLETALATTRHVSARTTGGVCCGTFGRIDILLHAATVLRRNDLLPEVTSLGWSARQPGGASLVFSTDVPNIPTPGYFDGFAGIGYVLLRLAAVGELPCVLAFE